MTTEKRCLDFDQARMKIEGEGDEPRYLTGYAVVEYRAGDTGTEFRMGDRLVERVKRSAIDSILAKNGDIIASFNHNPDAVLGRRSNGTLELFGDEIGLGYRIQLPNTTYARDLLELIHRRDVKGSSFMGSMQVSRETEGEKTVRWVTDIDIAECGPVSLPAYEATTAAMRSIGSKLEEELRQERLREHYAIEDKLLDLTLARL